MPDTVYVVVHKWDDEADEDQPFISLHRTRSGACRALRTYMRESFESAFVTHGADPHLDIPADGVLDVLYTELCRDELTDDNLDMLAARWCTLSWNGYFQLREVHLAD